MKSWLVIQVNQQTVLQYDRSIRMPGKQRQFLDKMDVDMDHGFTLDGQLFNDPDTLQKGNYVAMRLIQAIQDNNKGMTNAMCAYLVTRFPKLKTVGFEEHGEKVKINFSFD